MKTKDIKNQLTKVKKKCKLTNKDFLSTGSTMLNLACTDRPNRGFKKGHYYLLVGTSQSGKTWLSLSCLAEAACNHNFDDYVFIHDDVEYGALMNIKRFFGERVDKRLKIIHSFTIEDFYDNLSKMVDKNKPFIYILDSMDGLSSEAEIAKFNKQKKGRKQDKETAGSYGDGKARVNSQNLRRSIRPLKDTGSILLIINQNRDKLTGYGGKTRSGGHAMQYYATLEIWSDVKTRIKKVYKGKERLQGTLCTLRVRKNRVRGKDRTIQMPIYNTYGMDDIGSCVDYLISEKYWKKTKSGIITAPEFEFVGKRNSLIKAVSEGCMEKDLSMAAASCWKEIEKAIAIHRKPRYT